MRAAMRRAMSLTRPRPPLTRRFRSSSRSLPCRCSGSACSRSRGCLGSRQKVRVVFRPGSRTPISDATEEAIHAIREAIAAGDVYQVNQTFRLRARFRGDSLAFYERLRGAEPPPFAAYLNLGRRQILSASPELFFHRLGNQITTRPMKGTRRRGRWREEDDRIAAELAGSEKDRAENVMIVDLLRSDLGRLAQPGSVRVPRISLRSSATHQSGR